VTLERVKEYKDLIFDFAFLHFSTLHIAQLCIFAQ